MNTNDFKNELELNESEKQLIRAELDASHKKWVNYVLENKDKICSTHHPIKVKKKKRFVWREFCDKIKKIMGLEKPRNNFDGIEAYLQYSDDFGKFI